MRRREREQVAEVARRRLVRLSAELAGIRPEEVRGPSEEPSVLPPRPLLAGPPAGFLAEPRSASGVRSSSRAAPLAHPGSGAATVPNPGRHARERRRSPGRVVSGWLGDRMPDSLRGRVALSSQHTAVVVGVAGTALALAGWLALRSGSHDQAVPQARFVASTTSPSSSTSTSTRPVVGRAPTAATVGTVVVDVVGKVQHPGIVTLPSGSRVHDAIKKAGGARRGTKLAALNLARVLVDGEQIVVGQPAPAGLAPSAVGSTPGPAGGLVNLNAAGLSELDTLPGVGPVTAQKILDWRTSHGAFSSVDELLEVDGIGQKTLADIAPHVTL
ncbi:MAG: helix-hairpin-helix domain-containing protein [Marmoricola sp.]